MPIPELLDYIKVINANNKEQDLEMEKVREDANSPSNLLSSNPNFLPQPGIGKVPGFL